MTVKVGFIKHPFKSVGKASANITGAMSQGISDVFISPISQLTDTASDFLSSPVMLIGVGLIGVIAISSIFKASDTANKFAENPESIAALAQAMR
jgi:hypothetical protein